VIFTICNVETVEQITRNLLITSTRGTFIPNLILNIHPYKPFGEMGEWVKMCLDTLCVLVSRQTCGPSLTRSCPPHMMLVVIFKNLSSTLIQIKL